MSPWGILLQQHQQDLPGKLVFEWCGQERAGLLLQPWVQEFEREPWCGQLLRGLPREFVLRWERGGGELRAERGLPSPVHGPHQVLLLVGLQRGKQQRVRAVSVPYLLLRRRAGTVQRGDFLDASRLEPAELLVHPWEMGTVR